MRPEWVRAAVCVLVLGACGGCGAFGASQPSAKSPAVVAVNSPPAPSPLAEVLDMMRSLPTVDPAQQAEIFQSAKTAVAIAPTTSNKLRFGLAMATPGHGGSDPVAAQRQLSELLATPETLLPEERSLALVELQDVDQRLILMSENKQLRDDASRETRDKQAMLSRRLAAETDDNLRLRKSLEEAQAKLDAVTHIERSINNRGSTAHQP